MREQIKSEFTSFDGAKVVYRHCPSQVKGVRRAVILLHQEHEHSGRVIHLADELGLSAFDFFAWDARGSGESQAAGGDAPGLNALTRDLDWFIAHIRDQYGIAIEDMAMVAQSVGAVVAAAWAHDYAPRLRALALVAPAFRVRLGRSGKSKYLTHDKERARNHAADPLVTHSIPEWLASNLQETSERLVLDAQAINVPLQLLVSGDDAVVQREPQDRFFERIGSLIKERHLFPGFYHDLLGEKDRAQAVSKVRAFLMTRFQQQPVIISQLNADKRGHTYDEAERLAWPLDPDSEHGKHWEHLRSRLRWGGKFSEGLRIGIETGFDSPSSLAYVQRNQPQGKWFIGKMIDRRYLESPIWQAFRARPHYLKAMIREAMRRLTAENVPVRVVDIAAGHGDYLLEALADPAHGRAESIRMFDSDEANVQQGKALIKAAGAEDIATFERGDAFDMVSLATLAPKPTLAVVSWLYELYPDNKQVRRSLEGLAAAVPVGGYLLYTNQPWHPQQEFIVRALSVPGSASPRVIRRRTQQEMDELVGMVSFRKVDQYVDPWGVFTMSLAQRIAT
ncbi:MAG: bifunctional alpha/beta hydrolase/class I SAM-dependent methyltransferase [Xanthomonadaceae bacterium]|jgi:alpha-beta hydrolase superfamily lysophospholipase|nr:bifunctional alpha/beta hydrolase/class I SAM-dependent methyltransferase [Xanthomonadaceae bacterium]